MKTHDTLTELGLFLFAMTSFALAFGRPDILLRLAISCLGALIVAPFAWLFARSL